MPGHPPPARRRLLLRGATGLAAAVSVPPAARSDAARTPLSAPGAATLLVPGPENGAHARWSSRLATFLTRGGAAATAGLAAAKAVSASAGVSAIAGASGGLARLAAVVVLTNLLIYGWLLWRLRHR